MDLQGTMGSSLPHCSVQNRVLVIFTFVLLGMSHIAKSGHQTQLCWCWPYTGLSCGGQHGQGIDHAEDAAD